jgi:ketosteroid isomerase-like protein
MSANLDLVRSLFAAWERGDYSSVEWAHPEIEFAMSAGGTADGRWTGLAGMAQGWRGYVSAWKGLRVKASEYRELDDERVLVLIDWSGQGRLSGIDLSRAPQRGAILFRIRNGSVTQLIGYGTPERALADLGLKE